MNYSIGEVSKILNLSPYTIRYYDKAGLLFPMDRESGARQFTENDVEHLRFLCCLRSTGMSLADIKTFFELSAQGDCTLKERYAILKKQHAIAEEELKRAQHQLDVLECKQKWFARLIEERLGEKI